MKRKSRFLHIYAFTSAANSPPAPVLHPRRRKPIDSVQRTDSLYAPAVRWT